MFLYLHRQVAQLFFFTCQTRRARSELGLCLHGALSACVCGDGWCVVGVGGLQLTVYTAHACCCGNLSVNHFLQ